jgi:hypothetical protein
MSEQVRTLWTKWPHTEPRRNYDEATEADILAQPCVVAAIAAARAEGHAIGMDAMLKYGEHRQDREDAELARRPDLAGQQVLYTRFVVFAGAYEDVAKQVAMSLPAGDTQYRVLIRIQGGEYVPR